MIGDQNRLHKLTRRLVAGPLLVVGIACTLAACTVDEAAYVERPVEELYNEAMDAMQGRNYGTAAVTFDEVERQHPYSSWATKAQLMSAYAHFQAGGYDDAIIGLDRFIQLHPSNRDVPYALYLKGLCYYEQISDVSRDQQMTREAMASFGELIKRYPESQYTKDAKVKVDLTFDHLAGKEMNIGRYYLRQGHYLAAINRFQEVVERYQTTTHVPEALLRMVEAYMALGVKEEAKKVAAVLGHNFPGSEWYINAYELVEGVKFKGDQPQEAWYKFWK
ncbi:MAG: outer membrane protein assembly factor BamD [Rhodospirillales bacterium]